MFLKFYKTIYLDHDADIAANLKIGAHVADHGIFPYFFPHSDII